jgi:tetrahydromethanopterin S-methyltransferase subunit D
MLEKCSVFMMVLLVAATSLIGISSIYIYVEGQAPPAAKNQPQPQQQAQRSKYVQGVVTSVLTYASSNGKACIASVILPSKKTK